MGLFGRKKWDPRARLGVSIDPSELSRIGKAAFMPSDPRGLGASLSAVPDVSEYYMSALSACDFPSPGTVAWSEFVSEFLDGLLRAVDQAGGGWALVGAFHIARDLLGSDLNSPTYAELTDRAVLFLRDSGVPYQMVPPFALERWYERVGMDGLRPADWPASIGDP